MTSRLVAPSAKTGHAYFSDLLDIVLPGNRGVLVVLSAYFDASQRPDGTFCVAGYAFAKQQVKKFDKEWWALFGEFGGSHMTDLALREKHFKGIDDKQAEHLIKGAVKIINRRISFGVAVSCNLGEINSLLPKWIKGFEHAYPVCCHLAMHLLGGKVAESGHDDDIAYFFECGDDYSASAHEFMQLAGRVPELTRSYRLGSSTFIDKTRALSLQAADILAWEWAKYRDETVNKRKRNMRRSLAALLGPNQAFDSKRYKVMHITGSALLRYTQKVANLGLLQIEEDAAKVKGRSPFGG